MNNRKGYFRLLPALLLLMLVSCTVSYKFTGASIDYTKVKTVSITQFQNRAAYQWAPMTSMLNEALNDAFVQQTKLSRDIKHTAERKALCRPSSDCIYFYENI